MAGAQKFENRLLVVTLVVAVLLGIPAVKSIVSYPGKSDTTLALASRAAESRRPSSIDLVEQTQSVNSFSKSISIDLGCEAEETQSVGSASHLRLRGSACPSPGEVVAITNLSNGFTAEVIALKIGGFTTDFIDLRGGVNEIKVSRRDASDGQIKQQTIKVLRAPASQ